MWPANNMKPVYLDHAAATELDPRVRAAMLPFLEFEFGNPSAIYSLGRRAQDALEKARAEIAQVIGAREREVIFTSGGTESDNLAILGAVRAYKEKGNQLVISEIEHSAVKRAAEHLAKKEGFDLVTLSVSSDGLVSSKELAQKITDRTTLVSIMYANNEIGTIQPIREIVKAVRDWKRGHGRGPGDPPFVHTDACQAAGYLDINVGRLGVDLMTINGSKIYGPKGTAILFKREGIRLEPIIFGGGQEQRLRPGTENVAGFVGLAKALEIADARRKTESARLRPLRDRLISGIFEQIPDCRLNGHQNERLPNNVNVSISGVEGEALLLYLDNEGIAAATGSACDSESLDPSHVILALGAPYETAHSSLRFTLGRGTTRKDIDYVLEKLPLIVKLLRQVSPVYSCNAKNRAECAKAFVAGRPYWEKARHSKKSGS